MRPTFPRVPSTRRFARLGVALLLLSLVLPLLPAPVALAAPTCVVTNLNDASAGSLRQCLLDVDAGGTITFQAGLTGTIMLTSNLADLTKAVTLIGPGASLLTINRNDLGSGHAFTVDTGGNLVASGITIAGGDIGVLLQNGSVTLTNSILSGNDFAFVLLGGSGTLANSTASGNFMGVYVQGGVGRVANATFSSNGTGMYAFSGSVAAQNVTISGNVTGVQVDNGSATLTNTIVANSSNANCVGTIGNVFHNLDSGTTCGFGSANGSQSNTPAGLDPVGLADNGGPTQTIALLPTSAALNAGHGLTCAETGAGKVNGIDQRGVVRPQGAACDIGAYEATGSSCTVTNLADSGLGTLRDCLAYPESTSIAFQAGLSGIITLASNLTTVTHAMTVTGPGANLLTINRNDGGFPAAAFTAGSGGSLTASGLTLSGAQSGVLVLSGGGATLTNLTISGNSANGVAVEDGGSATVTNTTISGNDTGVWVQSGATAELANVTVSTNAIGVQADLGSNVTLTNATISGNGIGIFTAGSTLVTNTIVAGNSTANCNGTVSSGGHNLDTGTTCAFGNSNGNKSNTPSGLDSSGLLNNGGPTKTISLNLGSAALDAGDNTFCNQGNVSGVDQRGMSRPQGAICDIGAFERATATCAVTNLDDSGAGTLRNCLIAPEVITITVQAQGTITLASNLPTITDGVTINGPGANLLTIERNNTQSGTTVFTIATDGFLTASGLTLAGAAIGVLVSSNSTAALNNVTFSDNSIGLQVSGGVATVTNATFSGNSSGVFIQSGSATLANVTIAGNTIRGMAVAAGTVALTNATIASNGTGIERTGGTVTLTNTILALNSAVNCNGTVASSGNNLDSGTTCGFGNTNGNKSNTPAGLSANGLQFNGGQTRTLALVSNSSAIGAGNNTICGQVGSGKVNGIDQRGVVRPQGAVCDIGAFELTDAACTVTSFADSGAGTLRSCLDPTEIVTVTFQSGLTGIITLTSNLPTLTRVVSLTGPGASLLTVNRNNLDPLQSVFTVGDSGSFTVSGLTLVGAETGLWVQTGGSVAVTDVVFNGNIYGLWTDGTSVSVTDSTLSGNNYGLVATAGTTRVTGATFAGSINGVFTTGGTTSLINATLTSNATGVYVTAGSVALTNVTVANNTEGIHRDSGSATLTNTIVTTNTNANCSGTVSSGGHNLDSGTTCAFGNTNGNKSSTPAGLAAGLANNGGPTQTIALLPSSAAVNAGDDDICNQMGIGKVNGIDQRGTARPQGAHCDIGAFELVLGTVTLTTSATGTGTGNVSPATGDHPQGEVVSASTTPNAGSTFIGWMVDGVYAGWASTLTITMDESHTVQAIFAPTKLFTADVPGNHPNAEAITALASRGNILGYDLTHYGPSDPVERAQMAVLIARATPFGPGTPTNGTLTPPGCTVAGTWDCEDWGNTFTDRGGVPASLWRAAGTLQHYGVAFGYTAQDCAARNKAFPCYGPTDPVSYAQTIAFISRAMIAKGYWVAQPNAPLPAGNVPGVLATPIRTFAYYTGGVPNAPADWNAGASRGWFAEALWAALDSYWGTDGLLPDGLPAGGMVP